MEVSNNDTQGQCCSKHVLCMLKNVCMLILSDTINPSEVQSLP